MKKEKPHAWCIHINYIHYWHVLHTHPPQQNILSIYTNFLSWKTIKRHYCVVLHIQHPSFHFHFQKEPQHARKYNYHETNVHWLGLWGKQMVDGIQLKRLEDLKNTRFEIFGWRKRRATSDGGSTWNAKKNW
jgi:hypothetical protein